MPADGRRETLNLLADTARRVFAGGRGEFAADWQAAEEAGLPFALASEEMGGIGGGFAEARAILYAAGRYAAALPIAEALLAAKLIEGSGIAHAGSLSLARAAKGTLVDGRFSGTLSRIAFGVECTRLVALIDGHGVCLSRADAGIAAQYRDAADVPFADLSFDNAPVMASVASSLDAAQSNGLLGFFCACQIGGAIDAALALSVQHVKQREQFGRPLAAFQAIQQQMAVMAEEAAAANAAAMAAADALDAGQGEFAARACQLRASRAAGEAASIAHQVHGAIGFTREYALQRFTRRLWCWRSEFANERELSRALGERAARVGADGFWPALVAGFPA